MIQVSTQAEFGAALAANESEIEITSNGAFEIYVGSPIIKIAGSLVSRLIARGSSQPHVEAWESSQPHVEARGSSQPHVVAWESSQPHVEARESSQPHVVARGSSQPHVVARGSSQPHVEAWESSQPHVEAWESSQPHVVAWESSQPHVVAWGSSQPHVVAWGYVQLSVFGRVIARLSAKCSALIRGTQASITGGVQTRLEVNTATEWCDYYGVEVIDGAATLYKALGEEFRSGYFPSFQYVPGTTPISPDWDGGKAECGGGLHFSPSVSMAIAFNPNATKFVACKVALADIAIHPDGSHPEKCKARGACAPCWEVDRRGKPVVAPSASQVQPQQTQTKSKLGAESEVTDWSL